MRFRVSPSALWTRWLIAVLAVYGGFWVEGMLAGAVATEMRGVDVESFAGFVAAFTVVGVGWLAAPSWLIPEDLALRRVLSGDQLNDQVNSCSPKANSPRCVTTQKDGSGWGWRGGPGPAGSGGVSRAGSRPGHRYAEE